jgi:Ca2+-binding RTX toxin-like protein
VTGTTANLVGGDESNQLDVRRGSGSTPGLIIEDAAGVQAGAGCEQQSPTQVACGDGSTTVLQADLGAGDDRLTNDAVGTDYGVGANGGPGDDHLEGGSSFSTYDVINGGPGNDTIIAADEQHGDDGDDDLSGTTDPDELHGGPGDDKIEGQSDNDKVFGDDGNDDLNGSSGDDTIDGGDGEDSVTGDFNLGNPGNDTINVRDGYGGPAARGGGGSGGGEGPDFTLSGPRKVTLAAFLKRGVTGRLKLMGTDRARVSAGLVLAAKTARKLGLGRKNKLIGGVRGVARGGTTSLLPMKVEKRYRKKLRKAKSFKVFIVAEATDPSGTSSATVSLTVKR